MEKDTAKRFVSKAICEFFDPDEVKIAAVQDVLDAAGFDAKATCWPVFGGIWLKSCEGKEAESATAFLKNITDTMQRGKFELEVEHVQRKIAERTAPKLKK